jgi:hypothetical protein
MTGVLIPPASEHPDTVNKISHLSAEANPARMPYRNASPPDVVLSRSHSDFGYFDVSKDFYGSVGFVKFCVERGRT